MPVPQPTRGVLLEPESPQNDPGLTPLGPTCTVERDAPGLNFQEGEVPTEKTVPAVGRYIEWLQIEQRQLLGVALKHARRAEHNSEVVFLKRTNPYETPANWGLEIIDKAETQGDTAVPLYVVFVEPQGFVEAQS